MAKDLNKKQQLELLNWNESEDYYSELLNYLALLYSQLN